jgi:hypothetical protein
MNLTTGMPPGPGITIERISQKENNCPDKQRNFVVRYPDYGKIVGQLTENNNFYLG